MGYTPFVAPADRPYDITPPAFGDVGGSVLNQEVISAYDIYKPNEMIEVFARHHKSPSFRLMLKNMGFARGTAAPTTGHYEYPWEKDLLRVGTIDTASTGAGTDVVVVLASDGMYDTDVSVSGGARQASYPRVGEMIVTPDGKKAMIVAKDTSVSPHEVTLRPVLSTVDLAGSVVAATNYFISDNAHAEGSGLPTGRTPRVMKYSNEFQIVKERVGASGSELTNQTYFNPVPGRPGSLFMKADWDTQYRFECATDGALIWGTPINNISEFSSELGFDVSIKGTEGLINFAETNGYTVNYTPGSMALADFDAIARIYEQERVGTNDIMSWQGYDYYVELENLLQSQLNADLTAQLSRSWFRGQMDMDDQQLMDDSDFALTIGFYALRKGGYNFAWKKLHLFSEAVGAGAAGYDYSEWSIYHPLGYTKNKANGTNVPTIGYEYKQLGNYSREVVVANLAGVGVGGSGTPYSIAVNQYDTLNTGYVSEIAFHGTCANHIILHTP